MKFKTIHDGSDLKTRYTAEFYLSFIAGLQLRGNDLFLKLRTMVFFKKKNHIRPMSKAGQSMNSSMGSMTQSQLNTLIMDMLSLPQAENHCKTLCRGNGKLTILSINLINPLLAVLSLFITFFSVYILGM